MTYGEPDIIKMLQKNNKMTCTWRGWGQDNHGGRVKISQDSIPFRDQAVPRGQDIYEPELSFGFIRAFTALMKKLWKHVDAVLDYN